MKRFSFLAPFCCFLALITPAPIFAMDFYMYCSNGVTVPIGKVTGVSLMNLKPYTFQAGTYYLDSYNFAIGTGIYIPNFLNGRFNTLFEIDFSPQKLSKVGQIIANASTEHTEEVKLTNYEFSAALVYDIISRRSKFPMTPYIGFGIKSVMMSIEASGYTPESRKKNNVLVIAGIDVKIFKSSNNSNVRHVLKLEVQYSPNINVTTVPDKWRFNIGFSLTKR